MELGCSFELAASCSEQAVVNSCAQKNEPVRMLEQTAATEGIPNVVLATVRATTLDHSVADHAEPDTDQQPAPARIAQRPLSAGTL